MLTGSKKYCYLIFYYADINQICNHGGRDRVVNYAKCRSMLQS